MKKGLFTILFLAFSPAFSPAFGYDMQPFVNAEMQMVEVNNHTRELQAESISKPQEFTDEELNQSRATALPLRSHDSAIRNVEPLSSSREQVGSLDRPQPGFNKTVDPAQRIQSQLAEQDQLEKARRNYRNALHKEFVRRANADGVEVNRNIAKELEMLERISH